MSKVLIIEDDDFYRKIYTKKFEIAGFTVEAAENGSEGIQKIYEFHPDIIFSDLMMPQMDGFQVLQKIKADPGISNIPVVILTNLSTTEDAEKVMSMGAAGIMVKSDTEPHMVVDKANAILGQTPANATA